MRRRQQQAARPLSTAAATAPLTRDFRTLGVHGDSRMEGASPRRWLVLCAFALNSAGNAFMFMDFSTIPDPTKQLFGFCSAAGSSSGSSADAIAGTAGDPCEEVGDSFIAATYSGILAAVLPALLIVMAFIDRYNLAVTIGGMAFNCLGAWLRWLSVHVAASGCAHCAKHGRVICIISCVCVGFGAAAVVCSYAAIPARWFPPSERTLATSIAVQSNYAGWCVGALLFPYAIADTADLERLQLYQAVAMTAFFVLFATVYRDRQQAGAYNEQWLKDPHEEHMPFKRAMANLATNWQYVLQCLCYATLVGVSFAIPAFQTTALQSLNLDDKAAAWTNVAFIATGLVTGIASGRFCSSPSHFEPFLKLMFIMTSVGLLELVMIAEYGQHHLSPHVSYVLLVVGMAICGGGSLGFVGIALAAVGESAHPGG